MAKELGCFVADIEARMTEQELGGWLSFYEQINSKQGNIKSEEDVIRVFSAIGITPKPRVNSE